jgi:hypothetical protein
MNYSLISEKLPYYLLFLCLFIIAQSLSMWGQFVTLPYKNLSMWEAYKMSIPFAWLDWVLMTFTVMVGNKYDLVTPTQDTFLLIIIQFCLILLINQFYLKQKVTRSDIVAFFIILLGFFVSFLHLVSKIFNIPVPEHPGTENPDTISSTLKSQLYNAVTVTKKGEPSLEYSKIEDVETQ